MFGAVKSNLALAPITPKVTHSLKSDKMCRKSPQSSTTLPANGTLESLIYRNNTFVISWRETLNEISAHPRSHVVAAFRLETGNDCRAGHFRIQKEGTTDRRRPSHPPQCTTSREDRQIVRMTVTNRSVTSRRIAQRIQSITHHSVSARTTRRRLQQSGLSARRPLLGLPMTQNHRRLRRQWCDEKRM
ncbi:transposable element Tc1 transposase [Trichonephila clavipes]|nr:transposable element Tc1 transposase [Trichonephila clavipes]